MGCLQAMGVNMGNNAEMKWEMQGWNTVITASKQWQPNGFV